MQEGRTIGTRYGNNGMGYEQPADLAMPATTYRPTYVPYRQNLMLNTLVWGLLTLSQILPIPYVTLGYYILVLTMTAPDWHTHTGQLVSRWLLFTECLLFPTTRISSTWGKHINVAETVGM